MSIDWGKELDKVEEGTKPISEGPHTFRIVDAKPARAQSSGNQMIRVTAKVEGGPDDGKTGMVNIVFSFENPRAMKMTLRRLTALGVSEEMLKAENPSIEQIAAKILGRQSQGNVTHREWNGETQNDIDFIGGAGAGVPSAPSVPAPNVAEAEAAATPAAAAAPAAAPAAAEPTPPSPDQGF